MGLRLTFIYRYHHGAPYQATNCDLHSSAAEYYHVSLAPHPDALSRLLASKAAILFGESGLVSAKGAG